jgi:hypothetical protein
LTANIGWLGLQHLMKNGGSGYFPLRIVLPHLAERRLHIVAGAPEFSVPAYVVYPVDSKSEATTGAIGIMHRLATATKIRIAENQPDAPCLPKRSNPDAIRCIWFSDISGRY